MTEKRFNIEEGYYQGKSRPIIYDEESSDDYYFCGDYEDFKSICKQFNDFDIENKNLKKENRTLKLLVQNWEQLDDEKDEQLEKMNDSLKRLVEENKELQERNNRQAKQLDKLYKLIEKQDYKTLQNIIQDFKEAEELLKQEWRCLDD